jgi:hypothetical protein
MNIVMKGVSYNILVEIDIPMKLAGLLKNVFKWNLWPGTNR